MKIDIIKNPKAATKNKLWTKAFFLDDETYELKNDILKYNRDLRIKQSEFKDFIYSLVNDPNIIDLNKDGCLYHAEPELGHLCDIWAEFVETNNPDDKVYEFNKLGIFIQDEKNLEEGEKLKRNIEVCYQHKTKPFELVLNLHLKYDDFFTISYANNEAENNMMNFCKEYESSNFKREDLLNYTIEDFHNDQQAGHTHFICAPNSQKFYDRYVRSISQTRASSSLDL